MDFLRVERIYQSQQSQQVLEDVNFGVSQFQHTAIMGETGSGKSSLLQIIAGFVSPRSGDVYFQEQRLLRIPEEKLIRGHKGIAYLNQQSELPGFLRVKQVLEYANILDEKEATGIYEICRISHLLNRRTDQLSGGEKQRIAIARLLTTSPQLLLLDEPFSSLDTIHKEVLKKVLNDIGNELGITCVMIAHDPQDTLAWAHQLIVLRNGKVIQQGSPADIYYKPVDHYTAALGGAYNFIPSGLAESFLSLWNYDGIRADMMIRPEKILISTSDDDPTFLIMSAKFHGSFTILECVKGELTLKVIVIAGGYESGATVRLSIDVRDLHFIS